MPAASPEDDDVVVHADADTEFLQPHCGSSHFSQLSLPRPFSFFLTGSSVWKSYCILLTYTKWIQHNNVLWSAHRVCDSVCFYCCAHLHACQCIAWHAGRALFSSGGFSVSFCSYCLGHKSTVMWGASLINSGNWAVKLPSSLRLEENKNNPFLASRLFVYTLSPLMLHQFDTDLFQMLRLVFECLWSKWKHWKCFVRQCTTIKKKEETNTSETKTFNKWNNTNK